VTDGGFRALHVSYPSPHILRRNFTLRPFNIPFVVFTDPQKEANSSFSPSMIESILETSTGNFKSFQAALEDAQVRGLDRSDL
jgi:tyrosinase